MTRRGIIVTQSCVLALLAAVVIAAGWVTHLATGSWRAGIGTSALVVVAILLTLVWASLDLARDRTPTP